MRRIPVGLALVAVAVSATACGAPDPNLTLGRQVAIHTPSIPVPPTTAPPRPAASAAPPAMTIVATIKATVQGHSSPNGPATQMVPENWYGYASVLPVLARQDGWIDVRLAQRPDQATAWIPASDATLATTPWYLELSLTTEHLKVYKGGQLVYDFPAGVGTPDDPTPSGHYFVAMTVPPPSPAYGAFVLATSDHSTAIDNWEGMGDAIIGIHGPIDSYDDELIGTTGARVSHGCVRLHDAQLAELSGVLPGSPLDVTA